MVDTTDVGTQTQTLNLLPPPFQQTGDPYDMFNPYARMPYLTHPMPIAGSLESIAPWPYNPLPNVYKAPTVTNPGDVRDVTTDLVNGLRERADSFDPLENFNPHDHDDEPTPLEQNGNDIVLNEKHSLSASSEYALFPDAEPLCSPKTSSHISNRDDLAFGQSLPLEHERDQRSYATALKDHKEGQQSLPGSVHSDYFISPGARSRSSSSASTNNLSRSASSNDYHASRESLKSPSNRSSYVGIDDIDPQQKPNLCKSPNASLSNQTFSYFFENLPDSAEYAGAMREKRIKPGWKPLAGKHEKSGRRLDFKPQYIDKEGRVRHGVRVRGALKSMECWLHTNNKPPLDCLFAHSRIGDTLEYICIKCTVEKPRNHECRDKKGHSSFICNMGPYRDVNGEKWRGKVEPS